MARWGTAVLLCVTAAAHAARPTSPPAEGERTAAAPSSAALRATVFGTAAQDMAPRPDSVPMTEMNIALPWVRPVPAVLWFDRKLRVWFSAQPRPAPLAVVIAGTGGDGNTPKLAILRGALYGAGYHVLTMPSPTFPGFIVSASSTGVAGDLVQDGHDLYAAMQVILAHVPRRVRVTDIDILGYSLGGANAAIVKSIDAAEGRLHIRRALMINPPVNLFASIARLDQLFATAIGTRDADVESLYRRLYVRLATVYRASDRTELDRDFVLGAAAEVLKTDAELSAAIALSFRLDLADMFFAGDLYAGTGVITDPKRLPKVSDSLEATARAVRARTFVDYTTHVFVPYYLKHRPGSTPESLVADNALRIVGEALRRDSGYFAQTNSDDLILDAGELAWLKDTLGARIVVYDHGGHVGNLGERRQIRDMLEMLAGRWAATPQ